MANDRLEKLKKVRDYIHNTSEITLESSIDAIEYFNLFYQICFHPDYTPHYIYAIYDASGILPAKTNRYDVFVDTLMQNIDIKGSNILEVGGGTKYRTGLRIAEKQLGTITVYDKQLYTTESSLPNLKLCREEFSHSTNLEPYDLIIGQYPCQATELMVKRAMEENKNLFIHMCRCVHPIEPFSNLNLSIYGEQSSEYQQKVIDYYMNFAQEYGRTIDVFKNDNVTNPFIYSHRK